MQGGMTKCVLEREFPGAEVNYVQLKHTLASACWQAIASMQSRKTGSA